ncbi:unnamed protein product, partial [Pleuronectes platessa]
MLLSKGTDSLNDHNLLLSLTLIWALTSTGEALVCETCTNVTCSNTSAVTCPTGTMCITASIQAVSSGTPGQQIYKACAPPSLCPATGSQTFSVNLGVSSSLVSATCCNTDSCNSNILPFPVVPADNSLQCHVCNPIIFDCSSSVQCRGTEDRCFEAVVTNTGGTSPAFGCASTNLCAAAASLGKRYIHYPNNNSHYPNYDNNYSNNNYPNNNNHYPNYDNNYSNNNYPNYDNNYPNNNNHYPNYDNNYSNNNYPNNNNHYPNYDNNYSNNNYPKNSNHYPNNNNNHYPNNNNNNNNNNSSNHDHLSPRCRCYLFKHISSYMSHRHDVYHSFQSSRFIWDSWTANLQGLCPPSLCPATGSQTFSVNLGVSSSLVSATCCNTDSCNSNILPFPVVPADNSLQCHVCNPITFDCSSSVQCRGTEDRCFEAVASLVTTENGPSPAFGCASSNLCAAAASLGSLPFVQDVGNITSGPACCGTSFCNTVTTGINSTSTPTTTTTTPTTTTTTPTTTTTTPTTTTTTPTTTTTTPTTTTPTTTTTTPTTTITTPTTTTTTTTPTTTTTTPTTTTTAPTTGTIAPTTTTTTTTAPGPVAIIYLKMKISTSGELSNEAIAEHINQ